MGESFYSDGDYGEDAYSASPYFLFAGAVSFAPSLVGAIQKLAGLGGTIVSSYSVAGGTDLQKGFAGAVSFSPILANSEIFVDPGFAGVLTVSFEVTGSLLYEAVFAGTVDFAPTISVDLSEQWVDESDPGGPWSEIPDPPSPWINNSDPEGNWTNG